MSQVHSSQAQDLNVLDMPLQGQQVIEASAGTGKTWTLAALYVRLVLGHRRDTPLLPPQILVMTFTDAATAELRDRIRERLSQAAVYFDASAQKKPLPADFKLDQFLIDLKATYEHDEWSRCALQLNCAIEWMDDAAIYTIHAWSRRMLSQFALDSSNLFEQSHLENAHDLQRSLVQDYWRTWFYPLQADALACISTFIGDSPDHLLESIQSVWKVSERDPQATSVATQSPQDIVNAHLLWASECKQLAETCRRHWDDEVYAALQEVGEKRLLSGVRSDYYSKWLEKLQNWVVHQASDDLVLLARFSTSSLVAKNWQGARDFAFFSAIEAFVNLASKVPETQNQLTLHAAQCVGEKYQWVKTQQASFDFSDLLQNLYRAVTPEASLLGPAIRQHYPVALVDEFQDTDKWQYGTLHRIYADKKCTSSNALVMIGDPKQAIYSFRGADLSTYLNARTHAQTIDPHSIHTLRVNHRSTSGLVNAINHVFTQIDNPFACAQGHIDYVQVSAKSKEKELTNTLGPSRAAMTVWHIPYEDALIKADRHLKIMSEGFADQMALLLNQGFAKPGEMAVLVRGQYQADAIRKSLAKRQIPSVYLSDRSNVYASPEAMDMWRLLRAVASPKKTHWVRAAIASNLWALSLEEVLSLTQDETQWQAQLDNFHHWQTIWQQQGVLAMLYHWLHSQEIASRLLAQENGERRISNVLHLGELLQRAAQSLQGEQTLVRFLSDQINTPTHSSDAQKIRLETDAQCVQVITYHKSKGLEFPLVFVPFAGNFKTDSAASKANPEDEASNDDLLEPSSVDEDMRLLYVALTRAQRGLWLGVAETHRGLSGSAGKKNLKLSALSKLLKRQEHGDLSKQIQKLWASCEDICVEELPRSDFTRYTPTSIHQATQNALIPKRQHHSLWWTASFSALTRGLESQSKRDEDVTAAIIDSENQVDRAEVFLQLNDADNSNSNTNISAWQNFPAGARYGTLMHDLLDWLSQNQWPNANPSAPEWVQLAWAELLRRKAKWLQLDGDQQLSLDNWLRAVVQSPLPLDTLCSEFKSQALVLGEIKSEHMWSEMEFHLEAHHVSASTLDQYIQSHLFAGIARPPLHPRLMQGMLTGSLDLVVQHDQRYWVVDYKSNKLSDYSNRTLLTSVLEKRYEVQYVLYILALHRLLKVRLPNYSYAQHMGGAIYIFMRGIENSNAGLHWNRPPQILIETLDRLFAGVTA